MKEDPPVDAKCRDKFLVQSVAITPDRDLGSVTAIVSTSYLVLGTRLIAISVAKCGEHCERRSRRAKDSSCFSACRWRRWGDSTKTGQRNSKHVPQNLQKTKLLILEKHLGDDAPPAYGSPTPSYGSPGPEAVTPNIRSVGQADSQPSTQSKGLAQTANNAAAFTSAAVGGAATSVANAVPTSTEELQAQLAQAKAQIAKLTSANNEQGLRQRKADAVNQDARERISTGTTGMGIQQQPGDGVPVQIVAALCLLSFLLAYFLF